MKYSFTFDSVSAYQSAKATSSSSLYKALNTATSGTHDGKANADGALTRTAISTIKGDSESYLTTDGRGQTFIDSVNIIVPREDGGEIGDTLLYKSSDGKYYWLKGRMLLSRTRSQNGSNCYVSSEITSAGYVFVGFVGHREGRRCLIFYNDTDGLGTAVWGVSGTSLVTERTLELGNGGTSKPMSVSLEAVEGYYGESIGYSTATYIYPVARSAWNEMVAKIYANENSAWSTSGIAVKSSTNAQGWKVDASTDGSNLGTGAISVIMRDSNTATEYDPADYDYDFEKWYRKEVCMRFPSAKDKSVFDEYSGQNSTAVLNNASSTDYPIAAACLGYGVTGVSDFGAGKWWWPCMRELLMMYMNMHILKQKGIDANKNYWSCTPFNSTQAWSARSYLAATAITKTGGPSSTMRYLPVTEFYV